MKVLGCKLSKIRQMFLIESGTIGFIGGVIGCLFSVLISFVLNNFTVWMQVITGWLMSIGVQVNFDASSFDVGALFGMGGMGGIGNISDIPAWLLLMALIFATVVGLLSGIASGQSGRQNLCVGSHPARIADYTRKMDREKTPPVVE